MSLNQKLCDGTATVGELLDALTRVPLDSNIMISRNILFVESTSKQGKLITLNSLIV